jgi:hypothetical protein
MIPADSNSDIQLAGILYAGIPDAAMIPDRFGNNEQITLAINCYKIYYTLMGVRFAAYFRQYQG